MFLLLNFTLKIYLRNLAATRGVSPSNKVNVSPSSIGEHSKRSRALDQCLNKEPGLFSFWLIGCEVFVFFFVFGLQFLSFKSVWDWPVRIKCDLWCKLCSFFYLNTMMCKYFVYSTKNIVNVGKRKKSSMNVINNAQYYMICRDRQLFYRNTAQTCQGWWGSGDGCRSVGN